MLGEGAQFDDLYYEESTARADLGQDEDVHYTLLSSKLVQGHSEATAATAQRMQRERELLEADATAKQPQEIVKSHSPVPSPPVSDDEPEWLDD